MTTAQTDFDNETKPRSIRTQPWSEFPKQSYSIHTDKFCHENPLVVKFLTLGSRSALIIKEIVSQKNKAWHVQDDLKLWFELDNKSSLYTRVRSTDYIKVHYDHGLYKWKDQQWNLYGSFWTNKSLSKSSVRLGLASIHPRCWSDNRLRINSAPEVHNVYFYNRTLSFWNQTKFGLLAVVDLTNKVLQKNNILLGHIFADRHEVFLRLENNGFKLHNPNIQDVKSIWDTITLNYVGRLNQSTKAGIQGQIDILSNTLKKVQAVMQKILPQQAIILKAKVNNHHEAAFLVKRAMWGYENLLTFSAGYGVKNALSQKVSHHWGVQLDFNI